MTYQLAVIFTFSIIIPAIIGGIRFTRIHSSYYPFLFCIWLGLANEIIGYIIIEHHHSNGVNGNIYVLAESLLLTWQFRNWGSFQRYRYLFPATLSLFIVAWVAEAFFMKRINIPTSYFRIIYSFAIVLMSINVVNRILMRERRSLLKNAVFVIAMSCIIYYTFKVIVDIFWLYALDLSLQLKMNITAILMYINLFTNLMFAFAILWMPTKHRFSQPF